MTAIERAEAVLDSVAGQPRYVRVCPACQFPVSMYHAVYRRQRADEIFGKANEPLEAGAAFRAGIESDGS